MESLILDEDQGPMTCDLHWISLDQQSSAVLKAQQRIETATELQSTCYLLSPTHGDQSCSPAAHVITMSSLGGTATSLSELHHGVVTKC